MRIAFIRHGKTAGNMEKRYIGITDEPLCDEGIKEIKKNVSRGIYPKAEHVFSSPMKRCRQTAGLIYPDIEHEIAHGLKECNFGRFEGKNYEELNGDADYQAWIDSRGLLRFPDGDDLRSFGERCKAEFLSKLESVYNQMDNYGVKFEHECESEPELKSNVDIAFVIHGGTIMALFSAMEESEKDYFDWFVENGRGFLCDFDIESCKFKILKDI